MPEAHQPDLSFVIPVYFNEGLLGETLERIRKDVFLNQPDLRHEVIFVDDGSGDGSYRELLGLQAADPEKVGVVRLTRNFGQTSAILAGLAFSRGRCAVVMSADGQDPPALVNDMLKAHREEGYEIVAGSRTGRDESLWRIATSGIFYGLMRRYIFPHMPTGGFDFVFLGPRALAVYLRNREAHPFFQGQLLWTGFRVKFIGYRRKKRRLGASRWTFGRKLTYLLDGVISYSFLPLRLISAGGILAAFLAFLYAALIFTLRITFGHPVKGWAPLIIVVLGLGGLQMLMLGVIGEYLWRVLAQVQGRDSFVVDSMGGVASGRQQRGVSDLP